MEMKKIRISFTMIAALCVLLSGSEAVSQTVVSNFLDVQSELESILTDLSNNIEKLDDMRKRLERAGKKKDYEDQKNILLSSVLSIAAISSICEYENDSLSLLAEMRERNRKFFYDVRIESLEISKLQIENIYNHIQICHSILPMDQSEPRLMEKEKKTIESSIDLMNKSIELIKSIKR